MMKVSHLSNEVDIQSRFDASKLIIADNSDGSWRVVLLITTLLSVITLRAPKPRPYWAAIDERLNTFGTCIKQSAAF